MSISKYEAFLKTVELGSLTKAADALGYTQSGMTYILNSLEDECGLLLVATSHLEVRIKRGVKSNKKGYNEIWSRIGRKCVALKGVSAADITAVCEANGVTDPRDIDAVINDSECDLRRVRRKIHAITKQKGAA